MPSHKTLEEYRRVRDTAPYPHYYFHNCSDCNWFRHEYIDGKKKPRKNFCVKWDNKVNPNKWSRDCFVFPPAKGKKPIDLRPDRNEDVDPRPFVWKKGFCKWHRKEFYYKQYHPNDVRRYCSDSCRRQYRNFIKQIKKNSQLLRPKPAVSEIEAEKSSQSSEYSFSILGEVQSARGPRSSVRIKIPIWIFYQIGNRYFAHYCSFFVIQYSLI